MTTLSEYNADTMVGIVYSEHAPHLDAVVFKDIEPRAFNRVARQIHDIEKAAYEQGKTDLKRKVYDQLESVL